MGGGPGPLTAEESRVLEANAIALGVPLETLIAHAARVIADEALSMLPPPPARVAVLVGPGQNGEDGLIAARHLAEWGFRVTLYPVPSTASPAGGRPRRDLTAAGPDPMVAEEPLDGPGLGETALVVDALLGVGHLAPLRPEFRIACRAALESGVPILSVDVPTGLGDPDGIRATRTVSFTAAKADVPIDRSGEVRVRDIGVPPAAWEETGPGDFLRYPPPGRLPRAGRAGRVVVIGGGPYAGAPALAGLAALRAGAERATLIVPESAAAVSQGFSPVLVVRAVGGRRFAPEFVEETLAVLRTGPVEAIVIGPGAGSDAETVAYFRQLIARLEPTIPCVVDADALPILEPADEPPALRGRRALATPNEGEFVRLYRSLGASPSDPLETTVPIAAKRWETIVLAKGALDRISDGERLVRNAHHHPSMAVAGSGDVLDGVLAALLAAGLSAWASARLGTYWLGEAAQRAGSIRGPGLLSTDLIEALPEAWVHARASLPVGLAPIR